MNNFKVVAFYTANTIYEKIFNQYLWPSLLKWDLPYSIIKIPNEGNWFKNVAHKPRIVLEELETNAEDLVILDVDAKIEQNPVLFYELDKKFDIACHILEWKTWYNQPNSNTKELLSGTIYLRNNPEVKQVCKAWKHYASTSGQWEQKALQRAIKENKNVKFYNLPVEYCYINSLPNGNPPYIKIENPVIVHYQISRDLKKGTIK